MKKINPRDQIFNQMKLPELFAQALSEKLDKPYEETLKYVSALFESKIQKAEEDIGRLSQQKDISIDNTKDFEEWIKDENVIKG